MKKLLLPALVTVELKGEEMDQLHFSVWTADDLETPIQTMETERVNVFHEHDVVDANFDETISGILTYTNAGDKTETFYRWEDGRLVCFRKEEIVYHCEDISWERVIYERVNGELAEVSREPVQMLG